MDPLETETAHFWENHGEFNDVDLASIQTEVIELPTTSALPKMTACWSIRAAGCNGTGPPEPPGSGTARHLDHGRHL